MRKIKHAVITIAAATLMGAGTVLSSSAATLDAAPSTANSDPKIGTPTDVSPQACSQPGGTRPTLKLGSTGQWVTYLQCLINERVGYDFFINPDGSFGYRTLAGVLWLQVCEENALGSFGVDGQVGPQTWSKAINPDALCHL